MPAKLNLQQYWQSFHAWHWRGQSRQGLKLRGVAFSPPAILRLNLWQQGIVLKRTRHVRQRALYGQRLQQWQLGFTKAWLSLLKAGIPQLEALSLLQQQAQHAQVARWLTRISQRLHAGVPLHQSLAQSGAGFSHQYCRLVEVGENSGSLSQILQRIVSQSELRIAQRRALKKALTYPMVVLGVAALVVVAMLYFVVPQFVAMYQQMNAEIPAATALLIRTAEQLQQGSTWALLSLPIVVLLLIPWLLRSALNSAQLSRWVYRLPYLGTYLARSHVLHDMATLQLAYASAMPLTDACQLTARSAPSALMRQHWQQCGRLLASGSSLDEILQQHPLMPEDAIRHVRIGEQSGRLLEQLEQLIATWQQRADDAQGRFLKALEPAFLLLTGGLTAGILMALYIPLFQLGQLVG